MKIPLTIVIVFFSCLKLLYQNIDFEKKFPFYSIRNNHPKECLIVGLLPGTANNSNKSTPHFENTDFRNSYITLSSEVFHSASISEVFTPAEIIQLVNNYMLNHQDMFIRKLSECKMMDIKYDKIKIKQLLTTTSGLKCNFILKKSPKGMCAVCLYNQNLQIKKIKFIPRETLSLVIYGFQGYKLANIVMGSVSEYKLRRSLKSLNRVSIQLI